MASKSSVVHQRHFLVCPVCKKTQATLSVHLRRVCMKQATPEDITAVVDKAKAESLEILKSGIVFSYGLIQKICEDADPPTRWVEELQRRHMVVTDVQELPHTDQPATSTSPQPRVAETSEGVQSDEVSSGEAFQCERDVQLSVRSRKLMAEKGLHRKHSLDHPLLKSFANHLEIDMLNENFKQEVENVARFMFYMNPVEPSLEFVRDKERTTEFFSELSAAKLSGQTQFNYMKSIQRFLQYTNLKLQNKDLHEDCVHFLEFIAVQKNKALNNIII